MQPYRSPMSYTSETPRRESDVRRANMHEAEGPLESAWESIKSFFGKGPKGYKRSDERIREDVSEALYKDHHVDASDIEVSVSNGEVTLTGTVTDRRMKRIAEDCVESVSGVEDVRNELRVQSSMTSSASTTSTSATDTTAATSAASMSGRTSDRTDRTKARSTPDQLM